MKRNKLFTLVLSMMLVTSNVPPAVAAPLVSNPTGDTIPVKLENKYWYKVKLPAIIDLTYDQDTVSYRNAYELQACGEIPDKMLQIETDDVKATSTDGEITLENYIGRADLGEKNHKYVLGANEGETSLTPEWQSVKGLASHDFHGVKPGNYAGNANFKFKLIDSTDASEKYTNNWSAKTWSGSTSVDGNNVWTDGDDIYYSYNGSNYILDEATSTWSVKEWAGLTNFSGNNVWTDGDDIYYSSSSSHYVLDKATSTWSVKEWTGLTSFSGNNIWTDEDNIYYSAQNIHYVLDKATSTWSEKTWNGLTSFIGAYIWIDGDNIYYSNGSNQYVLDKATSTWSTKTWSEIGRFSGNDVWTDGDNIYYSNGSNQYVFDKATSTWSTKTWSGLTAGNGRYVWTDGDNIYYSFRENHYVLDKTTN